MIDVYDLNGYAEDLDKLLDDAIEQKEFDVLDAFYLFSSENHGGQNSRAYSWLSKLTIAGYKPSASVCDGYMHDESWLVEAFLSENYHDLRKIVGSVVYVHTNDRHVVSSQ